MDVTNDDLEVQKDEQILPTLNDVKKDLMITKDIAVLDGYQNGKLYYKVNVKGGVYRFPINVVNPVGDAEDELLQAYELSPDLGETFFASTIKSSELIRWISKAYENGDFVKISV